MRTILIKAEVLEEQEGTLFVELKTGFGNPKIRVLSEKAFFDAGAQNG